MIHFISLFLILLSSCSVSPPKVHIQSSRFIDIEIEKDKFYMTCSNLGKEENKSLMTFYAINGDTVHEFFFRRISETNWCENKVKRVYDKLIKGMETIRLVGISPLEKEANKISSKPVPVKFKKPPHIVNWTFIRLETAKGCKAYFEKDCKPENYWAGYFPQN